jgi:hypothetical protein
MRVNRVKQVWILVAAALLAGNAAHAQLGPVIWEENFNNLDNWIKVTGNDAWSNQF